ncbi:MAG TPA: hypothetical protein DCQ37_11195 [Desulfobacteraceae bacterium]|nr:hypothetical protein [Desulfobacteraceae bacterium]
MDSRQIFNTLIRTDPFNMLDTDVLKAFCEKVTLKEYKPNMYVFRQGEPSQDCLFVIVSGFVEITVSNDRGVETVMGLRRIYDFFGETVVLSGLNYPGAARVKDNLVCCLISRKDLEELLYHHPEFSGFFSTLLAERVRMLYKEIITERSYDSYLQPGNVESALFRKRVSEIMSYPVITCQISDKVTEVSKIMAEKDINAIVALDNEKKPGGILTEKNLVRYLIASQIYPVGECRVGHVMYSNLAEIGPEAFIGQALVAMMRSKTKHLIVMERGGLVGIVGMMDLIKTQSTGTLLLTRDIETQPDLNGLISISREIGNILNAMISEKAAVHEIFDVTSELHERLTRRVIQLSEEQMRLEGFGSPPVEYCWINMGSAARYEQTFGTDQDNALIYEDPEDGNIENTERYFARFAEVVINNLVRCGFNLCEDNIMATHPNWRRSYAGWLALIDRWKTSYSHEDSRIITTLLDYRSIWGNASLSEKLWKNIAAAVQFSLNTGMFADDDEFEYKLPLTSLGTFITEKKGLHQNEFDLKKVATEYIIKGIRLFAIKHNIHEPSTFGRLKHLKEINALSAEDIENIEESFESLMMLHIRENIKKIRQGRRPDNYIDPYSLRKKERLILKRVLSGVSLLLELVNKEFKGAWLKRFVS